MKYLDLWYILMLKIRRRTYPNSTEDSLRGSWSHFASIATLCSISILMIYLLVFLSKIIPLLKDTSVLRVIGYVFVLSLTAFVYLRYEYKDRWKTIERRVDEIMSSARRDRTFFWMTYVYLNLLVISTFLFAYYFVPHN
jgi:hypothetical protein